MEMTLIRESRANDPAIGYNLLPRFRSAERPAEQR
jgi:hypothetical protein